MKVPHGDAQTRSELQVRNQFDGELISKCTMTKLFYVKQSSFAKAICISRLHSSSVHEHMVTAVRNRFGCQDEAYKTCKRAC